MKHLIAYSPLPGFERIGVLAPMLPITFVNKGHDFSTFALVDSGAERALISTVIADDLGINWTKLPRFTGFTSSGEFAFRLFKDLEVEAFSTSFTIDVCIGEAMSAFKCIFGRRDIFKKARITFEGYKNLFSIEFRSLN